MNNLIPDKFNIEGNLNIKFEQDSLVLLALVIIIVVVVGLLAQRFISKM